MAVVLAGIDPVPKAVVLVPIANFAGFFAALKVNDPGDGVVEVQLNGGPIVLGHKGTFAVVANKDDRAILEEFLAAKTNLAVDASLTQWVDSNNASVVVTAHGLSQLIPKLTSAIRSAQTQLLQVAGEQGQIAADGLNIYLQLFTAAETEVEQLGYGVRIDSAQTLDMVSRLQFKAGGTWTQWATSLQPATEDMLAGLPAEPFVAVAGGAIPQQAVDQLMKLSVQIMKSNPMFKLTPEQAEKYAQLSSAGMQGLRSMRMFLGVPQPGGGIYSNASAVMIVDNSQAYLDQYQKTLAAMRLAQEVKSPMVPVADVAKTKLGDIDVLEVTMNLPDMTQAMPPGTPGAAGAQQMFRLMVGPEGKMKIYLAPADEHAIVMGYTSLDRLKSALEAYKSQERGLSADPGIMKVAALLPPGSQMVAYVSLSGAAKFMQLVLTAVPNIPPVRLPEFAASPPLGIAAKVTPTGVEGHFVVTVDTLRTIGDVVAKARQ